MSCWRAAVAPRPRHELSRRRLPQSQRSPVRNAGWSGSGGAAFARSSSGMCDQPSISPGSKPVKLRSKSAELWSSSLRLSSPGDAFVDHQTKGFHMGRHHSSQSSTGTSAMPSLRSAFSRRCGSTPSPSQLQARDFAAKLTDAAAHSIGCIVFA